MRDHTNQENVKLSDEDLEIIRNIQTSHFPDGGFDPYEVTRNIVTMFQICSFTSTWNAFSLNFVPFLVVIIICLPVFEAFDLRVQNIR